MAYKGMRLLPNRSVEVLPRKQRKNCTESADELYWHSQTRQKMIFKNDEERLKRLNEAMNVIAWDFRKSIESGLIQLSNEKIGGERQLSLIIEGRYLHLSDLTIKEMSASYNPLTEINKQ